MMENDTIEKTVNSYGSVDNKAKMITNPTKKKYTNKTAKSS